MSSTSFEGQNETYNTFIGSIDMAPTKIMLIRHAEKPDEKAAVFGVDEAGNRDPNQLSVRGWQRAGALVRFFAPVGRDYSDGIKTPAAIFASRPANGSLRSFSTVAALATALGIEVNNKLGRGEEAGLVKLVNAIASGSVLICWRHEQLRCIVREIAGDLPNLPIKWPSKRFDLVWVLDRTENGWCFSQVAQFLLPGDKPSPCFGDISSDT